MPKIPQAVIKSVFYLYRSREDAIAGKNPAGTGFIVQSDGNANGYPSDYGVYFGVTNWHVAVRDGASTIRLNTLDGGTDVIEFGPEEWQFIPGKYDVAAIPLKLDANVHDVAAISEYMFADEPSHGRGASIGVGEDAFMIGLFLDHDGVSINIPSARFGNVSMLPNSKATIRQPTSYDGESYVVDMHSRTGSLAHQFSLIAPLDQN